MTDREPLEVAGRTVDLSSGDKRMVEDGPTKRELVDHWRRVGELAVRWAGGRPLTLKRVPEGVGGEAFFQKNAPAGLPSWVEVAELERSDGTPLHHVVLTEAAVPAACVQLGTVELHVDAAPADRRDVLPEVVLDLDPPDGADVARVRRAARRVLDLCDELGLATRVKTSGSRGYHVHVGLGHDDGPAPAERARALSHDLADVLATRHEDELTTEQRVDDRRGRVLVDWWRNTPGSTTALPWTPRVRPGAPVATPIAAAELDEVAPDGVVVADVPDRLEAHGDPWDGVPANRLEDAEQAVAGALEELGGRPGRGRDVD